MSHTSSDQLRVRLSTEELCENLVRICGLNEELLESLSKQEEALVEVRTDDLSEIRDGEENLLRRIIEEEKERLLLTEELGDLLGYEEPASLSVAEILPHLPESLAAQLSSTRDRLREIAMRLARQNSLNRALIEHSVGHIQIFMSSIAVEEAGGPSYERNGESTEGDGDSFLMDKRA